MESSIREKERSWAISIISDINHLLRTLRIKIVSAGGESSVSNGKNSLFPDVLLYGDEDHSVILQGWELKMPDTSITNTEYIENAKEKARILNLNSFFLWNFSTGVLYVKGLDDDFHIERQWTETSFITTRDDVKTYKNEWFSLLARILVDINDFIESGFIRSSKLIDTSESIVSEMIKRNKGLVGSELRRTAVKNTKLEAYLSEWWNSYSSDYAIDEKDFYTAYAKTIILNWAMRILFAQLIKPYHSCAKKIDEFNYQTSIHDANKTFESISNSCDFYNVFHGLEYNEILPCETWSDLIDMCKLFDRNSLRSIPIDMLHNVLENTVSVAKREINGQFTTPYVLADILVRMTVNNWVSISCDPCCGTGTIVRALVDERRKHGISNEESLALSWAMDKNSFPLQLVNISLVDANSIDSPSYVIQKNALSFCFGESFSIVDPKNGHLIPFEIPRFSSFVSNLPFVPFEKIPKDEFPLITGIKEKVFHETGIMLDGRSDYYAYILFNLHKNLVSNGRVGVITSNSWLGTKAGSSFFKALCCYYDVDQVHISGEGRWFRNASIVAVMIILTKKDVISKSVADSTTSFCTWNESFESIAKDERKQNQIVNSSLLGKTSDSSLITLRDYTTNQLNSLINMGISYASLFHDVEWLLEIRNVLVPVKSFLDVFRGERRGWDKLFYPEDGTSIECIYLRSVIKNSRKIDGLISKSDGVAFCCSDSIERLNELGNTGAIRWIERFQSCVNEVGKPLPEVLKRSNLFWYEMKDSLKAELVTTMNPDKRLFFSKTEKPSFINQRLVGLKRKDDGLNLPIIHALLNSILGMFYLEAIGFGRGLGALDINSASVGKMFVLNPSLLDSDAEQSILEDFKSLVDRKVFDVQAELSDKDREKFDKTVLRSFGIDGYYDRIKTALLEMHTMRLNVR